jgi:hypothetical protein
VDLDAEGGDVCADIDMGVDRAKSRYDAHFFSNSPVKWRCEEVSGCACQ